MKNTQKIPKIIHYCWFGRNPKPKLVTKCIASWKKHCPDYEIKEWNEDNFDIALCAYSQEAYDAKKWSFVSDYARLWIVYHFGGFYLDTDVELTKSLDSLRDKKTFFASEDNHHVSTGLGFGALKGTPILKFIYKEYEKLHFKRPDGSLATDTPCPIIQTAFIENYLDGFKMTNAIQTIDDITFYPKEYFCPFDCDTREMHKTPNTIGIHHYAASWKTKKEKAKYYFINIPKTKLYRLLIRLLGEEQLNKLRRKNKS